ncbi:MAG: auracyanin family protein, partial [Cytophagales bacterium]|nr:auracyanin family protein [Cytophagales bacterium]
MRNIAFLLLVIFTLVTAQTAIAQPDPVTEGDYYTIVPVPIPKFVELEVGGVAAMPDGSVMVSTRYGDVWRIENAYVNESG